MIRFLLLFMTVATLSLPAMADEDLLPATEEKAEIKDLGAEREEQEDKRLELSRKMHEIWPVRPKVEAALDAVAEQMPEADRVRFKAALRQTIKFDALEQTSIDAMAEIFTVKELEAMIAFYGSKEGRSVSHKTGDYENALAPILTKMIDKALLDTKLGTR